MDNDSDATRESSSPSGLPTDGLSKGQSAGTSKDQSAATSKGRSAGKTEVQGVDPATDSWTSSESLSVSRKSSRRLPTRVAWDHPERIDHFRIVKLLGGGGFGVVYLAFDEAVQRSVVLKLPLRKWADRPGSQQLFIDEARRTASVVHPGIVSIFHVGMFREMPYLVQEYVAGGDLRKAIKAKKLSLGQQVSVLADVAAAVSHAHTCRVIHRDLKPSNILLSEQRRPLVCDFGLAVHQSQQERMAGQVVGTLMYMSPEQVRGESHRLDGRSDIWALGVILYECITGRRPFEGSDRAATGKKICSEDPRPPRQLQPHAPRELQRICLRCLAKPVRERYATASDLEEELRHWLEHAPEPGGRIGSRSGSGSSPGRDSRSGSDHAGGSDVAGGKRGATGSDTAIGTDGATGIDGASGIDRTTEGGTSEPDSTLPGGTSTSDSASRGHSQPIAILPRGLNAFGPADQGVFLHLLPGPKDRRGVPVNVRYWVDWAGNRSADRAEPCGLICGPSGCGKSSLVHAAVLPRLPASVTPISISATPATTLDELRDRLCRAFPEIPSQLPLEEILAGLRESRWVGLGQKVLLVVDQFEQWLHAAEIDFDNDLVRAMRQCDGLVVQALFLVRSDFFMSATRFFRELDLLIVEERNFLPVALFQRDHAKRVLESFGEALGKWSHRRAGRNVRRAFVAEAVRQLDTGEGIEAVRLALLTQTIRDQPWTADTLRGLGGMREIGVRFLQQTFSSTLANPSHRSMEAEVAEVLEMLLPDTLQSDITPSASQAGTADQGAKDQGIATQGIAGQAIKGQAIKGQGKTLEEIANRLGWAERPKDLHRLISTLDNQLQIITPVDSRVTKTRHAAAPETAADASDTPRQPSSLGDRHGHWRFQLTHDFLVPAIRQWLDLRLDTTPAGRARRRLAELAGQWERTGDPRFVLSFVEFLSFQRHLRSSDLSGTRRRLFDLAKRRYFLRALAAGLAAATSVAIVSIDRGRTRHEVAKARVRQWLDVEPAALPAALELLKLDPAMAADEVAAIEDTVGLGGPEDVQISAPMKWRCDLAQLQLTGWDSQRAQRMLDSLGTLPEPAIPILADGLSGGGDSARWMVSGRFGRETESRVAARLAIIAFQLGDPQPIAQTLRPNHPAVDRLRAIEVISQHSGTWVDWLELAESWSVDPNDQDRLAALLVALWHRCNQSTRPLPRGPLQRLAKNRIRQATSPGLVAACQRWLSMPLIEPACRPRATHQIELLDNGLVMIQFSHPERDFWLAQIETPQCLVDAFRKASKTTIPEGPETAAGAAEQAGSSAGLRPATHYAFVDIMNYCNWLSEQMGYTPVYRLETVAADSASIDDAPTDGIPADDIPANDIQGANAEGGNVTSKRRWTADFSADGFRLPTVAEWQFAAFADVDGDRELFGNLPLELRAGYRDTSLTAAPPRPVASWLPSRTGLFDIAGNCDEALHGDEASTNAGPTNNAGPPNSTPIQPRVVPPFENTVACLLRPGESGTCAVAFFPRPIDEPDAAFGFRLARTVTGSGKTGD
ncbi:MAG: protein kinase [Planctomycetota bacterium]